MVVILHAAGEPGEVIVNTKASTAIWDKTHRSWTMMIPAIMMSTSCQFEKLQPFDPYHVVKHSDGEFLHSTNMFLSQYLSIIWLLSNSLFTRLFIYYVGPFAISMNRLSFFFIFY